jgi:hypothetical protein
MGIHHGDIIVAKHLLYWMCMDFPHYVMGTSQEFCTYGGIVGISWGYSMGRSATDNIPMSG